MALADIRQEVIHTLAQTHEAQREAHDLLDHGVDAEKVEAAGELDFLSRQEALLKRRLDEVERRMSERRGVFSWARQAWFDLMFHFESWIAHG